jgi:hypothetical protein
METTQFFITPERQYVLSYQQDKHDTNQHDLLVDKFFFEYPKANNSGEDGKIITDRIQLGAQGTCYSEFTRKKSINEVGKKTDTKEPLKNLHSSRKNKKQ